MLVKMSRSRVASLPGAQAPDGHWLHDNSTFDGPPILGEGASRPFFGYRLQTQILRHCMCVMSQMPQFTSISVPMLLLSGPLVLYLHYEWKCARAKFHSSSARLASCEGSMTMGLHGCTFTL